MDELTIDFSQDDDFDAIKAKVLPFLKDQSVAAGQTVHCTIHQRKVGDKVDNMFPLVGDTVETLADMIAEWLAQYAKGKDGLLYSGVTISVR